AHTTRASRRRELRTAMGPRIGRPRLSMKTPVTARETRWSGDSGAAPRLGRSFAGHRHRHREWRQVATVAVVDRLRGVDPDLGEVGVVDLDPGPGPELVDEVLLRRHPLVAEQLVADRRLGVVKRLGHRAAAAGLLEHVP